MKDEKKLVGDTTILEEVLDRFPEIEGSGKAIPAIELAIQLARASERAKLLTELKAEVREMVGKRETDIENNPYDDCPECDMNLTDIWHGEIKTLRDVLKLIEAKEAK